MNGDNVNVEIELLDSKGRHMAYVEEQEEWGWYQLDLNKGTYYLKMTISGNGSAGGWVEIF